MISRRLFSACFALMCLAACSLSGPESGPVKVYALSDWLHNGILIVRESPSGTNRLSYYSFIELDYYLRRHTELSDVLGALFLNKPSAVEAGEAVGPYGAAEAVGSLTYAQIPEGWLFMLSEKAVQKGLRYMQTELLGGKQIIDGTLDIGIFHRTYYRSDVAWNFYYNCGNFTADVLEHMGIPVHAGNYAYSAEFLRTQLSTLTPMIVFASNR